MVHCVNFVDFSIASALLAPVWVARRVGANSLSQSPSLMPSLLPSRHSGSPRVFRVLRWEQRRPLEAAFAGEVVDSRYETV